MQSPCTCRQSSRHNQCYNGQINLALGPTPRGSNYGRPGQTAYRTHQLLSNKFGLTTRSHHQWRGRDLASSVDNIFGRSSAQHAPVVVPEEPPSYRPEEPIPVGLNLNTYPSLKGRNALVTGSAGGIGRSTCRLLAAMGATVYITDRRKDDIQAAIQYIECLQPGASISAAPAMDLASLRSVKQFAESFTRQLQGQPLHMLVNNAGANFMGVQPWSTPEGIAGIPQVNVLGPFALTHHLRPILAKADRARLVMIASVMHRRTELPENLDALFTDWQVGSYRNCKLATTMLSQEYQRRWGESGVVVTCADPGAVHSNIWAASILGHPPLCWALAALFAPPWDAAAAPFHAAACANPQPAGYYARGLFSTKFIVHHPPPNIAADIVARLLPALDWPLRSMTKGAIASAIECVPTSPAAQHPQKAAQLWEACCARAGIRDDT